jgi:serralysin
VLLLGGSGADQIVAWASGDTALGGAGDDILQTGAANVTLSGGAGDDTITVEGAPGQYISGGAGADTFVLIDGFGGVSLFKVDASDRIDVSDIAVQLNEPLHLVSAFTGHAGEMMLVYNADTRTTALEIDQSGSGSGATYLELHGNQTHFTDFVV